MKIHSYIQGGQRNEKKNRKYRTGGRDGSLHDFRMRSFCQGATEAAKTEETKAETAEGKEEGKAEEKSEASSDDPLKVVYLCNGNLGDKGFNDSAASGMQKLADEMGAEVKTIEMGRDETSYEGNYLDVLSRTGI